MKPTKETIKKFIGKKVKIIFYDKTSVSGILEFNKHPFKKNIYDLKNGFNVEVYFKISTIESIEIE